MDFRITEDQAVLVEGVRDYLTGMHGTDVLRRLDEQDTATSSEVRQGLLEMGLPGLLVPEKQGGLGLGLVEGALIALECGRAGLATPLVDTAFVAVPLLAGVEGEEEMLRSIATGKAQMALQHEVNPWVADLADATHVLGPMGVGLGIAERPPSAERLDSVDPLRRLYRPALVDGRAVEVDQKRLLDVAALMTAAQLVGVAEAMLAISVAYAQQRSQFGQPIGSFQAIKHHLATATVKIEFAKPVLYRAAAALEARQDHASLHVSHAKLAAGDAAWAMAETAIQVHGAMGYTYEVDLHFWMKRSWALAGAWGDRNFHSRRLAAGIINDGLAIGPAATFA